VGFVSHGPARDAEHPKAGEIYALYVVPEAWDTGAGRALLEWAMERLQAHHRTTLLWVIAGNARGRRFYEAAGFHADGTKKLLFHGSTIAVRYLKTTAAKRGAGG
jgi:GNAT superfamily N-acetyltransferase